MPQTKSKHVLDLVHTPLDWGQTPMIQKKHKFH